MNPRLRLTTLIVGVLAITIGVFGVTAFAHAAMSTSSRNGSTMGMGGMGMMSNVSCDHMMASMNGITEQCQAMCQQNMLQCQSMMQAQDMTQCTSMM